MARKKGSKDLKPRTRSKKVIKQDSKVIRVPVTLLGAIRLLVIEFKNKIK